MKSIVAGVIISMTVVCCFSCSRTMSKEQLQQYVLDKSNGLNFSEQAGQTKIDLLYRPKVLLNLDPGEGSPEDQQFIDSLDYFVLKLSRNGQEIENGFAAASDKYTEVINYLARGIGKDIFLKTEDKNVDVEDLIYTQLFGSSNGSSILIAFKSNLLRCSGEIQFIYDDSMFGSGRHVFPIKTKDIKKIPKMR